MHTWIERQRSLIDFALASLARRRARSAGLAIVYALLVFALASIMLFTHALREEATAVLAGAPEIVVQRMIAGRHDLIPPGYVERIGKIRGVQQVRPRLWGYFFDPVIRVNYTFLVPESEPPAGRLQVGATLARARGLEPGSSISLRSYSGALMSFMVDSILPYESELASADLVLIGEADFRRFFDFPAGHYTDIALSVANPLEVRNVSAKLAQNLPDSRPILREEMIRTYASVFDWREGLALAATVGALAAVSILAWDKSAGLSADEKREIGILKAIGWETADVMRMKFWEGTLISTGAFLFGFCAAYVHVAYFHGGLFEPVLKGWSTLYPEFALSPRIDGVTVATLFFFTVVPYVAAVMVPIWKAATTDPDAVMRS